MLSVYNPFTNEIIQKIPFHTEKEVEETLHLLKSNFQNNQQIYSKYKRIEVLKKLLQLVDEHKNELVKIAILEGGKPFKDTLTEVERAKIGIELAIEEIGNIAGKEIPMGRTFSSENKMAFTIHEPIGLVVGISAFNHPLNLIIHQTVTSFAAGCPFIIKPDLRTPLSCMFFMELFYKAGLSDIMGKCLLIENNLAEKLATDSRVNYVSFIGSAKVGWYLRSKIAPGTRIALEHGGVAPVIVFDDVDLDKIVPTISKGAFYHAGQVCVSVQKVYISEKNYTLFLEKIIAYTEKMIVGNPKNSSVEIGPIIESKEVERIDYWVKEAIQKGAKCLTGGKKLQNNCYQPTILLNPSEDSLISNNEVFGPVLCVYTYNDYEKAIEKANSLPYHFQSSVFSNQLDKVLETVNKLNASTILINNHTAFRADWMPFGGRDLSGIGIGGIGYSIRDMMQEKLIVFDKIT